MRVRGESLGMSRAGHGEVREWLGEREESDLNDVGPKTIGSGYTGQTGCPYRSDRSGPADRRCFGFVLCCVSLKLFTSFNLIIQN